MSDTNQQKGEKPLGQAMIKLTQLLAPEIVRIYFKQMGWFAWFKILLLMITTVLIVRFASIAVQVIELENPFAPEPGSILVGTPTVLSRERLVNMRLADREWLQEQLAMTHFSDWGQVGRENFGFVHGTSSSSTDTQSSLNLNFNFAEDAKTQTEKSNLKSGAAKAREDSTTENDKDTIFEAIASKAFEQFLERSIPSTQQYNALRQFRETVKTHMLRSQLDDRHDIDGNTLYHLGYDITVATRVPASMDRLAAVFVELDGKQQDCLTSNNRHCRMYKTLFEDWRLHLLTVIDLALNNIHRTIFPNQQSKDIDIDLNPAELVRMTQFVFEELAIDPVMQSILNKHFQQFDNPTKPRKILADFLHSISRYHTTLNDKQIDAYTLWSLKEVSKFCSSTLIGKDQSNVVNENQTASNGPSPNSSKEAQNNCHDFEKYHELAEHLFGSDLETKPHEIGNRLNDELNRFDDGKNQFSQFALFLQSVICRPARSKSESNENKEEKNDLAALAKNLKSRVCNQPAGRKVTSHTALKRVVGLVDLRDKLFPGIIKGIVNCDLGRYFPNHDTIGRTHNLDVLNGLGVSTSSETTRKCDTIFEGNDNGNQYPKDSFLELCATDFHVQLLLCDPNFVIPTELQKRVIAFAFKRDLEMKEIGKFFDISVEDCWHEACRIRLRNKQKPTEVNKLVETATSGEVTKSGEDQKPSNECSNSANGEDVGECTFRHALAGNSKDAEHSGFEVFAYDVRGDQAYINQAIDHSSGEIGGSALAKLPGNFGSVKAAGYEADEYNNAKYKSLDTIVGFSNDMSVTTDFEKAHISMTRFGWLIWPDIENDDGLLRAVVSAVLSVPSWWESVDLKISACWIKPEEAVALASGKTFENDEESYCRQESHTIKLPGNLKSLSHKLGIEVVDQPNLQSFGNEVEGFSVVKPDGSTEVLKQPVIMEGRSAQIVLRGDRLWRNPQVFLGSQLADSVQVLPDMEGLVAKFDCVQRPMAFANDSFMNFQSKPESSIGDEDNPSTQPVSFGESANQLPTNESKNRRLPTVNVPVRVWTSDGQTGSLAVAVHGYRSVLIEPPCYLRNQIGDKVVRELLEAHYKKELGIVEPNPITVANQ